MTGLSWVSGVSGLKVSIPALDLEAGDAARARQDALTKPQGSLGRLEEIACRLAAMQGNARPDVSRKWVVVVAADHGVVAQGVSAYPSEVTLQMVANFLSGGAAINVLARQADARVLIVDAGVAGEIPGPAGALRDLSLGRGTDDFTQGPAMSREAAVRGIESGVALAGEIADEGADLLAPGEMGIGNSTPAAAITAVFTGAPVADATGRGTGVDDEGFERKIAAIEQCLSVNRPDAGDPIGVLAGVGGFEIAVMAGLMLGGASRRIAIALDGFIATSAALIAHAIEPNVAGYMFATHRSVEQGHRLALQRLGLSPLLDLGMRLGEGTGAALAMGIIEAAVRLHNEMATFEEAAVSGRPEGGA
ncbi:MAG: nicotinate-nucleotide--dimethylbenzimidazole phosphoribosyltransferase [Chloroflexi bacterium]|nr:nicotinate-nucleotide--dimethylbenzimidazole phosphoribosyltransferase [Chloroflexota bacterium]